MSSVFTKIGQDVDSVRDRVTVLESGGVAPYHQVTPSASWTVPYTGAPRIPYVMLDSSPGELAWPEYFIVNATTMNLVFDIAETGFAYL